MTARVDPRQQCLSRRRIFTGAVAEYRLELLLYPQLSDFYQPHASRVQAIAGAKRSACASAAGILVREGLPISALVGVAVGGFGVSSYLHIFGKVSLAWSQHPEAFGGPEDDVLYCSLLSHDVTMNH